MMIEFPNKKIPGFTEVQRRIRDCKHDEDVIEYQSGAIVCGKCLRVIGHTDA